MKIGSLLRVAVLSISTAGLIWLTGGCSMQNSIRELSAEQVAASVSIADYALPVYTTDAEVSVKADTIQRVNFRGKEVMLMSAVKDEQTGEMVVADRIDPVVVEAKFRNIAERNGYVNIAFDINIPPKILYSECQLRLYPQLTFLSDTLDLDKVYITGEKYRQEQLRGYQLYEKFLSSIIPDSLDFIDAFTRKAMLEKFIGRNFKEIAKLKYDTSYVASEKVSHLFGVTLDEVVEHYSKRWLIKRNGKLLSKKEKMFAKYVKNPFESGGVKLDSVVSLGDDGLKYCYRYQLKTRKGLKKIDLSIAGELFDSQKMLYKMPDAGPVTYYVSSLTSLAQEGVKYKQEIVKRDLQLNSTAYITFKVGEALYRDTLASNKSEMKRVLDFLYAVLSDSSYVADSLIIASSSSPEGGYLYNKRLSEQRTKSIKEYLLSYMNNINDSINENIWEVDLSQPGGGSTIITGRVKKESFGRDFIKVKADVEPWARIERMMLQDSLLKDDAEVIAALSLPDYDSRERTLAKSKNYRYIKDVIYPELRRVDFALALHRPGMVEDTIYTYQIDSVYMRGVEALDNQDYKEAITLLQPYADLNTALAYLCMGYNHSAKGVLQELKAGPKRDYLLAVVYARMKNEEMAASHFLSAVEQDATMRHRGNLDPEISAIIKKYNLEEIYNQ